MNNTTSTHQAAFFGVASLLAKSVAHGATVPTIETTANWISAVAGGLSILWTAYLFWKAFQRWRHTKKK